MEEGKGSMPSADNQDSTVVAVPTVALEGRETQRGGELPRRPSELPIRQLPCLFGSYPAYSAATLPIRQPPCLFGSYPLTLVKGEHTLLDSLCG